MSQCSAEKKEPDPGEKFKIVSLGCKANQYDAQLLHELFVSAGLKCAGEGEEPGIWIIHTCSVTHVADRKARRLIRQKKRETPGARVFVTGCYAASGGEDVEFIEGVDGVFGPGQREQMLERIAGAGAGALKARCRDDFGINDFGGRSRAYVKIQDGCDSFCSYCIVPLTRGRPRSRPLSDALEEGRRMIDSGFMELVLTGIHLGLYGRDLCGSDGLAEAVREFALLDRNARVRLSSLEGPEVDEALLDAMALPNVCNHLHLPLQSGDAGVLKRMRRPYSPEQFMKIVHRARTVLHEPAVSTDVMVGFPGETEREFQNTVEFCRRAGFSRMHVFNFSPRPGTAAAGMGKRVDAKTASGRSERLRERGAVWQAEWAARFVGRGLRVLFETADSEGWMYGYSDRYIRVRAPYDRACMGRLVRTEIDGPAAGGGLSGRVDGSERRG